MIVEQTTKNQIKLCDIRIRNKKPKENITVCVVHNGHPFLQFMHYLFLCVVTKSAAEWLGELECGGRSQCVSAEEGCTCAVYNHSISKIGLEPIPF